MTMQNLFLQQALILALSQFITRRGLVKIITSDNRSNFISGKYKLRALVKELDNKRITQHLNSKNIIWKFKPALSPWLGGSWELIIELVKQTIRAISTDRIFTDETLQTYFVKWSPFLTNAL